MAHRERWALSRSGVIAMALGLATLALAQPAGSQEVSAVTVDTTSDVVDFGGAQRVSDLPGPDGEVSLREATIASTNTDGPETIAFDIPTTDPGFDGERFVIHIDPGSREAALTLGDDGTTLDATTQPGGFPITVEGSAQAVEDFRSGLMITSSDNTVVGLGLRLYGFGLVVEEADDNLIRGVDLRDNQHGIQVRGGATEVRGNVVADSTVSDNTATGVVFFNGADATVRGSTITGNARGISLHSTFGVSLTGNVIAGNGHGIVLAGSDSDGAAGVASANTVTGNEGYGVVVNNASGFTITRNSIAGNGELGINLVGGKKEDEFGVTENSKGGPNFPEKLSATDDGTATVVEGRVDYADPQSVTVELFVSEAPDPSGFGEGQTFVGTATPNGKGRFTVTLQTGLAGKWLTATATGATGTTSEFSEAVQVAVPKK